MAAATNVVAPSLLRRAGSDILSLSIEEFRATIFEGHAIPALPDALVVEAMGLYDDFLRTLSSAKYDLQDAVLTLLEELVAVYHEHKAARGTEVEFIPRPKGGLSRHPSQKMASGPNILAVPQRIAISLEDAVKPRPNVRPTLAWHHVAAGVYVAGGNTDHPEQACSRFLNNLLAARPDMPGLISLTVTNESVQFFWSDAAQTCVSEPVLWKGEVETWRHLVSFIGLLHAPRKEECTLHLAKESRKSHFSAPVWIVKDVLNKRYFRVEQVLKAPDMAAGRTNWIAVATQSRMHGEKKFTTCPRTIIKDIWSLVSEEASSELAVLERIHKYGAVPGVCHLHASFAVPDPEIMYDPLETIACPGVEERRKHRLILDGESEDFDNCPSAAKAPMVLYDVLEVIKHLHEYFGVTYRDISLANIMLPTNTGARQFAGSGMTFIGEHLLTKFPGYSTQPMARIIDYDMCHIPGAGADARLTNVGGTLPYIARLVSSGFKLRGGKAPSAMPALEGAALEAYVASHGQEEYDARSAYHDGLHANVGDDDTDNPLPRGSALHSPRHDAESCFWLLVHFLITALPKVYELPDCNLALGHSVCTMLEAHRVGRDTRHSLFSVDWANALHPQLARFAPLLTKLAACVEPIYECYDSETPLNPYHLHEAMQRVILQEVFDILEDEADVELNIDKVRPVGVNAPEPSEEVGPSPPRRGVKRAASEGLSDSRGDPRCRVSLEA
ncbi:hypothetical protein EXIGLDRAFT_767419 [Exidia glandulosa HHB12029]|uniref:Protein kinase domain-containing protein n=1 Tax=Exidia glandulosa HHB12029 TaxID=1314781 RepID=A0A165J054_EXIGL|nr:hypothetical protein EXIGLDRAFT_767419 [Exidia glandulosa HHB12029]